MSGIGNMRIGTRLAGLVALLLSLFVLSGGLALYLMQDLNRSLQTVYEDRVLPLKQLKHVADAYAVSIVDSVGKVRDGALSPDAGARAVADARAVAQSQWQDYLKTELDPQERRLVAQAEPLMRAADQAAQRLLELMRAGDVAGVNAFARKDMYPAIDPVSSIMAQLTDLQIEVAEQLHASGQQDFYRALWLVLSLTALALISGVWMAVRVVRSITRPINEKIVVALGRMAKGELSARVELARNDELGMIASSVNQMAGGLEQIVQSLQGSMLQIRSSVNQLSASVKETEATVSEQSATATEVAASTTEISQTARDLASTMTQLSHANVAAVDVADEGHTSLARLDDTLRKIVDASAAIASRLAVVGEKAGTISSVTSTITKVADQTNLLSLNAAIEAEKAGEYGQGFSVIATEIRRLADQTSVAAGDIEQTIREMQGAVSASVMSMDKFNDEVQRNVGDVKTLSHVLTQVIEHVRASAPQFETVSHGMSAQSEGASQINQAIRQFTESLALSTQTLRSTDQAAGLLSSVADQLQAGIARFRTA